jgi:hypothetical protein
VKVRERLQVEEDRSIATEYEILPHEPALRWEVRCCFLCHEVLQQFAVWRIYAASRTPFIVNFQRSWGMMFIGFCERCVKSVLRRVGVLDAFNNAGNEICIMNFK